MLLWLVLSGYFDIFFISMGMLSAILSVVIRNVLKNTVSVECYDHSQVVGGITIAKNVLQYCGWLMWQAVVSTVYVTKLIIGIGGKSGKPVVVVMDTGQKNDLGLFMLANSITFTPGTVGMKTYADGKIRVLALDPELLSGVTDIDREVSKVLGKTP